MLLKRIRDVDGKIIETKIQFSKSIHILNNETGLSSMLSFVSTIQKCKNSNTFLHLWSLYMMRM